jgi:hypothetical protein
VYAVLKTVRAITIRYRVEGAAPPAHADCKRDSQHRHTLTRGNMLKGFAAHSEFHIRRPKSPRLLKERRLTRWNRVTYDIRVEASAIMCNGDPRSSVSSRQVLRSHSKELSKAPIATHKCSKSCHLAAVTMRDQL